MPGLSVIMAVYNGEPFVRQAVESVPSQTFTDFEFIIIDDASTDATASILREYTDGRIVLLSNNTNVGLTKSLNIGLRHARGEFIARMDADDIALPERLERQVRYLDEHPDVGILGCACQFIGSMGRRLGKKPRPLDDCTTRWTALLRNPFIHPAVMLRRSVLEENGLRYDEEFTQSQDYEFFTRVLKYTRGANLSEQLLLYRKHPGDITSTSRESQLRNHDLITLRTIRETIDGFPISPEKVTGLRRLFVDDARLSLKTNPAILANLYVGLCKAFTARYSDAPSIEYIKRATALKAISAVVRCSDLKGFLSVLLQACSLHHGVVLDFLRLAPYAILRRLGRPFLRHKHFF